MGFLLKKKLGKKVSGVRFCILIKGARYKDVYGEDSELYITHSSLIRGYKFIGPSSISYAHSYKFPNPSNKSGYGMLGEDGKVLMFGKIWGLKNGLRCWLVGRFNQR